MELLILYIFLTISFSFLCSILEAVLLSINTTFIKIELKEGKKYAKNLSDLKNSIDEPLIIILTLNTIAHTVGAILVGVQAKVAYSELNLKNNFFASGISDEFLVGFVSTVMTIMILLFSEIIPKTIGAKYWNKLARFTTVFLSSIIPIFPTPVRTRNSATGQPNPPAPTIKTFACLILFCPNEPISFSIICLENL